MLCGVFCEYLRENVITRIGGIHKQQLTSRSLPWYQGSWGQHGAYQGPARPRWAPCWPHEPCYLGGLSFSWITKTGVSSSWISHLHVTLTYVIIGLINIGSCHYMTRYWHICSFGQTPMKFESKHTTFQQNILKKPCEKITILARLQYVHIAHCY